MTMMGVWGHQRPGIEGTEQEEHQASMLPSQENGWENCVLGVTRAEQLHGMNTKEGFAYSRPGEDTEEKYGDIAKLKIH
jgi:hypothetical protein